MITIALDEQGDFENLKGELETKPVFIGGVVYDDCDEENDFDNEKKRLDSYLRRVCQSVNCAYPKDLHVYSTDDGRETNSSQVRMVKQAFSESIGEFLEYGTYNNQPLISQNRKGKYYIFSSLRGESGKKNLLSPDTSEAVKDDFASNLYVHMAEDVVDRLIFHNPIIPNISRVKLELATRRVVLSGDERRIRKPQYETLGFQEVQRSDSAGTSEYILTNPDNYRTAIEREMLSVGQEKILIDRIGVKSIYYDNASRNGRMAFLFLADAICSYLGFDLKSTTPSDWINEFSARASSINTGVESIVWAYDEVDDYFLRVWKYLEEDNFYRALSVSFDGGRYESPMTSYYKERWFPCVEKYLSRGCDFSSFSMAVKKFQESILNNNLAQDKLVYVFENLVLLSRNVEFRNDKEEAVLYELYDCGVSAYIHISNLEKAMECFEKARKYAEYVSTERYLRTRNKMVVFYCDCLQFEKALQLADENVSYHEMLTEMKREMFGDKTSEFLNHAIALSQRGQVYAFLNDERAEQDYLDALDVMDKDTPDRCITESYLLHYYICKNNQPAYEKIAKDFYGGRTDLVQQFNYLVKEGAKSKNARFSLKFALYVYVKALYVFYKNEIPSRLLNKLANIDESLAEINRNAKKMINGHPWEIIYKYLALLMHDVGNEEKAQIYLNTINTMFAHSEGLIRQITEESVSRIENDKKEQLTYMYY